MTAAAHYSSALNRRLTPDGDSKFRRHLGHDLDVRQEAFGRQYPHGPMLGVLSDLDGKPSTLDRFRLLIDHHLWNSLQAVCRDFKVQLAYEDSAPIDDPPIGIDMMRVDEEGFIPITWGHTRVVIGDVAISFRGQTAGEDFTEAVLDQVVAFFEARA
ncbi:MAG: hypothetical protein ACOH2M_23225 [Cypionkella sp.]